VGELVLSNSRSIGSRWRIRREPGVTEADIEPMLTANPQRVLAFAAVA
jgi:hypothetical protein